MRQRGVSQQAADMEQFIFHYLNKPPRGGGDGGGIVEVQSTLKYHLSTGEKPVNYFLIVLQICRLNRCLCRGPEKNHEKCATVCSRNISDRLD